MARHRKLDLIEEVLEHFPDRVFACDEFGPLGLHMIGGPCRAEQGRPSACTPSSQDRRRAPVPRLLLAWRRRALGCAPPEEARGEHPRCHQADPREALRQRDDPRDLGPPACPPGRQDRHLVRELRQPSTHKVPAAGVATDERHARIAADLRSAKKTQDRLLLGANRQPADQVTLEQQIDDHRRDRAEDRAGDEHLGIRGAQSPQGRQTNTNSPHLLWQEEKGDQ